MSSAKWEIRLRPYDGFGYVEEKGKRPRFLRQLGTEVRYRPDGKRGRFECVIVAGAGPDDWQAFVTQYDDARRKRAKASRNP